MYKLQFSRGAFRIYKKYQKDLKEVIKRHSEELAQSPMSGETLHGKFSQFRSYHFKHVNVEYRIIYLVDTKEKTLTIVLVANRENLYKRLTEMKIRN
jgi:addiction module RelE/StbE family toxin